MDYKEYDKYDYLVIESWQGKHYGFNLNVMKERSLAKKIVSPDDGDDCMVSGWKVAFLPNQVMSTKKGNARGVVRNSLNLLKQQRSELT